MGAAYGALCTDFFINQKLSLKMDMHPERETVLSLFDRVSKMHPRMTILRRFEDEISLESREDQSQYEWLSLRQSSLRSGSVNPDSPAAAMALHRSILEIAPYFVTISPLDIESLEVVFGFDFETEQNRNDLVFDALLGQSPLSKVVGSDDEAVLDCQPFLSFAIDEDCDVQAFVDVKTRVTPGEVAGGEYQNGPLTLYCTLRNQAPVEAVDALPRLFDGLAIRLEQLVDERFVPHLLMPLREAIASRPG